MDSFLSSGTYSIALSIGSVLSPLLFLVYVNNMPDPKHYLHSTSKFAEHSDLWVRSTKQPWPGTLAAHRLQENLAALV